MIAAARKWLDTPQKVSTVFIPAQQNDKQAEMYKIRQNINEQQTKAPAVNKSLIGKKTNKRVIVKIDKNGRMKKVVTEQTTPSTTTAIKPTVTPTPSTTPTTTNKSTVTPTKPMTTTAPQQGQLTPQQAELYRILINHSTQQVQEIIKQINAQELYGLLEKISSGEITQIFEKLTYNIQVMLFNRFTPDQQRDIYSKLPQYIQRQIFDRLSPYQQRNLQNAIAQNKGLLKTVQDAIQGQRNNPYNNNRNMWNSRSDNYEQSYQSNEMRELRQQTRKLAEELAKIRNGPQQQSFQHQSQQQQPQTQQTNNQQPTTTRKLPSDQELTSYTMYKELHNNTNDFSNFKNIFVSEQDRYDFLNRYIQFKEALKNATGNENLNQVFTSITNNPFEDVLVGKFRNDMFTNLKKACDAFINKANDEHKSENIINAYQEMSKILTTLNTQFKLKTDSKDSKVKKHDIEIESIQQGAQLKEQIGNYIRANQFDEARNLINESQKKIRQLQGSLKNNDKPDNDRQSKIINNQINTLLTEQIATNEEFTQKIQQAEEEQKKKKEAEIEAIRTSLDDEKKRVIEELDAKKKNFNDTGDIDSYNTYISNLKNKYKRNTNQVISKNNDIDKIKNEKLSEIKSIVEKEHAKWFNAYKIYYEYNNNTIKKEINKIISNKE